VVPPLLADARIGKELHGHVGQAEGVIQLPVQEQSAVGANRGSAERQPDRAIELEPKRSHFLLTRRANCHHAAPPSLNHCRHADITGRI
jgi:hypothetical protein